MKNNFLVITILLATSFSVKAQLKIRPEGGVQMSYNGYNSFYLGVTPNNSVNNGEWSFESWGGGFNLWKPWPNPMAANYIIFAANNGNVGIGTGTPSAKLDVYGDIAINGVVKLSSDSRLKSNIKQLSNCLSNVTKLEGKSYNKALLNKDFNTFGVTDTVKLKTILMEKSRVKNISSTQYGLIAQDVQSVFPELVYKDSSGFLSVDYMGLIPVLIEALKEHKNTVDAQSLKIKEHEDKITALQGKSGLKTASLRIGTTTLTSNTTGSIAPSDLINAFLYDNTPNPFKQSTEIGYFIPESIKSSILYVFDMQGLLIKTIPITTHGKGSAVINGSELKPGMYIYSLIADGKEVDTKRMILTE